MIQVASNNHICGTCAHWLGCRQVNRLGMAELPSRMEKGLCGRRRLEENRKEQAGFTCRYWEQWILLR